MLKDENYLELVNNLIQEEKINYALPVYDLDFLKANDNIKMSIDSDQFLEVLFLRIRGETIKFATNKKSSYLKENRILEDIKTLENSSVSQANMKLLADKQEELTIRKQKVKGFITRTRLQWLEEGEKPTSYFCNLEKKLH